jgi:hypothetical protein
MLSGPEALTVEGHAGRFRAELPGTLHSFFF